MSNDLLTTVTGNVVSGVTMRYTEQGNAYAKFRVAHNRRYFERKTQEWVDGETTYLDVKCWGMLAENIAATIEKGMPVIVVGRLSLRSVEQQIADKTVWMTYVDVVASAVGPDLARGTAKFERTKSRGVAAVETAALEEARAVIESYDSEEAPTAAA